MNNTDYIVGAVKEIQGTSVIVRMFDDADQLSYFINGERYSGVLIGSYIGIDYYIHWPNLFNTHIAIFGNTGSGKSNTLTKLYTSLFDLENNKKINFGNSKFCFLDFNGEYTSDEVLSRKKDVLHLSTRKSIDDINEQNKFHVPYKIFWDKDLLSTIFGATEQTQQPFLSRVINFYFKRDNTFIENVFDYIKVAFHEIYSSEANLDSLNLFKDIFNELGIKHGSASDWIDSCLVNKTTGKFYSYQYLCGWDVSGSTYYWNIKEAALSEEVSKLYERLNHLNSETIHNIFKLLMNPIIQLRIATKLQMIHDLSSHTIQYDHLAPLLHRIEARSKDLNKVIFVESSDNSDFSINRNIQVISLKNVNKDIKMLLPLLIAKVTYSEQKTSNGNHSKIFNLIIDEAHNILSDRSSIESEKWKDYRLDVFEEIIKEGRKFGYYLTIASQRPADISATIVSQVHNYFIHRLVNDNDLKMLQNTLSSLDSVTRSTIPNLSPGQAIITGVSFEQPVVVQIDELDDSRKPDSSNTDLLSIWKIEK